MSIVVGAHDGVDLPVSDSGAILGARRTFGDMPLACNDTSTIDRAIAFAPFLGELTQVGIEIPTIELVVPDVAVDSGVGDVEDAIASQPTGKLLRTPIEPQ